MAVTRRRLFQIVASLAAICAYATIVVGGTVRGIDAGLACPDWPLCHGSIVPDLSRTDVAIEYAHRMFAVLTSVFVLLSFVFTIAWFRSEMRLVTLTLMTLALVITQVGFGALTITSGLNWVIVTVHLALGTGTLALALIVAFFAIWPPRSTLAQPVPAT